MGKRVDLKPLPRASSPEEQENQLIAMAYDLAAEQIRKKTVSSQVLTHFLKLGSTKGKLEMDILGVQKDLITAKTESIQAQGDVKELYKEAIDAIKRYGGHDDEEDIR